MAAERIGVVTGMVRETYSFCVLAADDRPRILCKGIGPARATEAAAELADTGVSGLVSLGTAGGLNPAFDPGTVVLAETVVTAAGEEFPCDRPWLDAIRGALGGEMDMVVGRQAAVDAVVRTAADKRALMEKTGAIAVDMESHAIARMARERGVPFVAVRAIADAHDRPIPPWVSKGVTPEGAVRPLAVLGGVLSHPFDLPLLFALRKDSERAFAALRHVAAVAGSRLGLGG